MTIEEFKSKEIWRTCIRYPNYEVSNKCEIRNKKTKKTLKKISNKCYVIQYNKKTKNLNAYNEMLRAFPDVTISDDVLVSFSNTKKQITGVYPYYQGKKPWRVLIQKNYKHHLFGYFKDKEDAKRAAITGYMMLNGLN